MKQNECHCGNKQSDPLTAGGYCESCAESLGNEGRVEGPKLIDLPFADLYEAWRSGYVKLTTWSGATYMVKVQPSAIRAEFKRLGITMKEAKATWSDVVVRITED